MGRQLRRAERSSSGVSDFIKKEKTHKNNHYLHLTKQFILTITGEYRTEVREMNLEEPPIHGQRKSLSCYNSEENKGNPEAKENDARWIHNGHAVRNDDRYEGASTRVSVLI